MYKVVVVEQAYIYIYKLLQTNTNKMNPAIKLTYLRAASMVERKVDKLVAKMAAMKAALMVDMKAVAKV